MTRPNPQRPSRPTGPTGPSGPRRPGEGGGGEGAQDRAAPTGGAGFSVTFGSGAAGGAGQRGPLGGVEGMLSGLGGLLAKLGELAEKGQELRGSLGGDGGADGPPGRQTSFHYGVSVRTLNDGREVKVEPFGNLRRDESTGETTVREVREPLCDVFEEPDHVLVVLEMPGVELSEVRAELSGDILTVEARNPRKQYRKELLLPSGRGYDAARMTTSGKSGVVEVRLNT